VDVKQDPYAVQIGGEHYKKYEIQPHEFIVKNKIGWSAGNAIKYLSRYKDKGGATDVRKAIHYCMMLLKEEYGETYELGRADNQERVGSNVIGCRGEPIAASHPAGQPGSIREVGKGYIPF
jgi:hypothetical protein